MVSIRHFTESDKQDVIQLFNAHCETEPLYKPWTEESFDELFMKNPHFNPQLAFVASQNEDLIGFAFGVFVEKTRIGYITMILVRQDVRRQRIGSMLLTELENALRTLQPKQIDCSFFNPLHLTWIIPGTEGHEHPNAPGVPYPSPAYHFFRHHGYLEITTEYAYYLELKHFNIPIEIHTRIQSLNEKGIEFTFFDLEKHRFEDLFEKLGNDLWRDEIHTAVKKGLKVLVPVKDGVALGFTGPIYPQANGRGYFAGIGVHPTYQGQGIGKALFFLLCHYEKMFGATYMSLFTGETNPARRMYESAGFTIAHSFKVMRKHFEF